MTRMPVRASNRNQRRGRRALQTLIVRGIFLLSAAKLWWDTGLALDSHSVAGRLLKIDFIGSGLPKEPFDEQTALSSNMTIQAIVDPITTPPSNTVDDLILFYHIYLPSDGGHAMSIVEEQLAQISNSAARNSSDSVKVHYHTVGNLSPIQLEQYKGAIDQICSVLDLQCQHHGHSQDGFEFSTLKHVRSYCIKESNVNDIVMYMHNKGSYHNRTGNLHLRRSMTTAISSRECYRALRKPLNGRQCNICGLHFSPWKSPFFPGNFWTASCQYVSKLMNPFAYKLRMRKHRRIIRDMQRRGELTMTVFNPLATNLGNGRYSAEFWVGSHPNIEPCDVIPGDTYNRWQNFDLSLEEIDLQNSPRIKCLEEAATLEAVEWVKRIPSTSEVRIKEYYLELGHILRWQWNYNQLPKDDSWFWKYFPDGELWKEAIRQHKKPVFEQKLVDMAKGYLAI